MATSLKPLGRVSFLQHGVKKWAAKFRRGKESVEVCEQSRRP